MINKNKIRALIIDDEPFARQRLHQLLEPYSNIDIIGECSDGYVAISEINHSSPDLIFLDIQMPEIDGFQVIEQIKAASMPVVIFMTAYDQYALRAFEACALDYLLKPCDEERFAKAIKRAESQIYSNVKNDSATSLSVLMPPDNQNKLLPERIVVNDGARIHFLRVKDIDRIEAQGNYIQIYITSNTYLLRETLVSMESQLDTSRFIRVHRSTIINIDRIKEIHPMFNGRYSVILVDGAEIVMSRRYRHKLEEAIGRSL